MFQVILLRRGASGGRGGVLIRILTPLRVLRRCRPQRRLADSCPGPGSESESESRPRATPLPRHRKPGRVTGMPRSLRDGAHAGYGGTAGIAPRGADVAHITKCMQSKSSLDTSRECKGDSESGIWTRLECHGRTVHFKAGPAAARPPLSGEQLVGEGGLRRWSDDCPRRDLGSNLEAGGAAGRGNKPDS